MFWLVSYANDEVIHCLPSIFIQIPKFIVNQVRKQNTENQKKEKKDKAMKKLLKKMAYDREKHEKQDKAPNDVRKHMYEIPY